MSPSTPTRLGVRSPLTYELLVAFVALAAGFGLMPFFIFEAGAASLGRYDGASISAMYTSVFEGFVSGSSAAWVVLLGPYGLYLLFRGLKAWWRAGTGPT